MAKSEEKQRNKDKISKGEKINSKESCPESEAEKSELDLKFDEFREEVKVMFHEFNDSFDKKIVAFEKRLTGISSCKV